MKKPLREGNEQAETVGKAAAWVRGRDGRRSTKTKPLRWALGVSTEVERRRWKQGDVKSITEQTWPALSPLPSPLPLISAVSSPLCTQGALPPAAPSPWLQPCGRWGSGAAGGAARAARAGRRGASLQSR